MLEKAIPEKKETLQEKDERTKEEIRAIIKQEERRGVGTAETSEKPSLDYYDNRQDKKANYKGKYEKLEKD